MKLTYLASLAVSIAPLIHGNPIAEDVASEIGAANTIVERGDDCPLFKDKELKILPLGGMI